MKRLSLLIVAFAFLMTTSGCCCGLFHGCGGGCGYPSSCGSCGYQPGYTVAPSCPTCPTCPGGGCGVQGAPVMGPGALLETPGIGHASLMPASPYVSAGTPAFAAVESLPNW